MKDLGKEGLQEVIELLQQRMGITEEADVLIFIATPNPTMPGKAIVRIYTTLVDANMRMEAGKVIAGVNLSHAESVNVIRMGNGSEELN